MTGVPSAVARGAVLGLCSGVLLAAAELTHTLLVHRPVFHDDGDLPSFVASVVLLLGAAAVVLGAVEGLLGFGIGWLVRLRPASRPGPRGRVALVAAALAAPLLLWLAAESSTGRVASQLPGRRWMIVVVTLAGAGAVGLVALAVLGLTARRRLAGVASALALAVGLVLYLADHRILAGLYPAAHVGLALAAFGCVQVGVALLAARWPPSPRLSRALLLCCVPAVLGGAWGLHALAASPTLRYLAVEHTTIQHKLVDLARHLGLPLELERIPAAVTEESPAIDQELRPGPRLPGANLLLISIDALRADHMGIYGYRRNTTPSIDAWARRATVFERGYCPTPHTSFSLTSLLTGRHVYALTRDHATIADVLRRRGYRTAAFFPPAVFFVDHERFSGFEARRFGFQHSVYDRADAARRVDQVIAFLERQRATRPRRPFFVWVHIFDPHEPYRRHPQHDFGRRSLDRYDSELAWSDRHVGRLLAHVGRHHRRTVVALTADHGEAFGEHGQHYHGSALFEEQIRVPVIVQVPGVPPRRVQGAVHTFDLPGTLMSIVGVPARPRLRATDLGPYILGEPPESLPPVFSEIRSKKAIIDGHLKLIHDTTFGFSELFDLSADPGERRNLAGRDPETIAHLRGKMLRWLGATSETLDDPTLVARLLERARRRDRGTIPALEELTRRGAPAERREALRLLVELRARTALDEHLEAREDADPEVRADATIGAALAGDHESISAVRRMLRRGQQLSPLRRRSALLALAATGDRSVAAELSRMLREEDDLYERNELVRALGRLGDPVAADALRAQLTSLRTRRHALQALGLVRDRGAVPLLASALGQDPYLNWRVAAATSLGQIGDRSAIPALQRAVKQDPEPEVVRASVRALDALRGLPVPDLVRPPRPPRWACEAALCRIETGLECRPRHELVLLLAAPPQIPLLIRCGRSVQAAVGPGRSPRRGWTAVVSLEASGPLALEGRAPGPPIRYLATREL